MQKVCEPYWTAASYCLVACALAFVCRVLGNYIAHMDQIAEQLKLPVRSRLHSNPATFESSKGDVDKVEAWDAPWAWGSENIRNSNLCLGSFRFYSILLTEGSVGGPLMIPGRNYGNIYNPKEGVGELSSRKGVRPLTFVIE